MAKDRGIPGNSIGEAQQFGETALKYGMGLISFEHICSRHWRGATEVTGFSVRPPKEQGGEWLVVVRGLDEEGTPVVAFHSALSIGEAVAGCAGRISNGSIKFKLDEFRA